jgi:hypothetical protein
MGYKHLIFIGLIALGLGSCTAEKKRNIRAYYFPVEQLRQGQVYEYVSEQGDSVTTEYWYYRSFRRDTGLYLAGTYYDEKFQICQILRESITENGAQAKEYFLYEPAAADGKQKQIRTRLETNEIFPFIVQDSSTTTRFSLKYNPPDEPALTIHVTRMRLFLGEGPDYSFRGELYPTVRFALRETIRYGKESLDDLKGDGEELYAEGLGLVQYRKSYGPLQYEYRLNDLFPMAELERRAGVE